MSDCLSQLREPSRKWAVGTRDLEYIGRRSPKLSRKAHRGEALLLTESPDVQVYRRSFKYQWSISMSAVRRAYSPFSATCRLSATLRGSHSDPRSSASSLFVSSGS